MKLLPGVPMTQMRRGLRKAVPPRNNEPNAWDAAFRKGAWRGVPRFADFDGMGLLNYAAYLHLIDEALFAWWERMPLAFAPGPTDFGLVTAAMRCAWLAPVRERSSLRISLGVSRVGRTSFGLCCAIRTPRAARPRFAAHLIEVYCPRGVKAAIPERLRKALHSCTWSNAQLRLLSGLLDPGSRGEGEIICST